MEEEKREFSGIKNNCINCRFQGMFWCNECKNGEMFSPINKYDVVAVSGWFDPIHIGHIRYFKAAKELGNKLVVILNTDESLKQKKGFIFMPFEERKERGSKSFTSPAIRESN